MIDAATIRVIADRVRTEIQAGCIELSGGDHLMARLHFSVADTELRNLQRLLDAPRPPLRVLCLVGDRAPVEAGEEVSPSVDDERWDRVPIPDWAEKKHDGGNNGDAA